MLLSFFLLLIFFADIEGRILFQHDTAAGVGAGQESKEYLERKMRTRWTNSIFGGKASPIRCLRVTTRQRP